MGSVEIINDKMIGTYQRTKAILDAKGLRLQKHWGQNFLIDPHVLDKIVRGAKISEQDRVVEIGPGIGALTERLAQKAGQVIAFEIDDRFIPVLYENLHAYQNVEVINMDFMKVDPCTIFDDDKPFKIVANLPYYVTTPIVMELFESKAPVESLVIMVQKEAGDRFRAKPGSKDYGAVSLTIDYYADIELLARVPRNCFIPRPNVDSVVLQFSRLKEPRVKVNDEKLMFQLIRLAFTQRRKTLVNCLFQGEWGLTKEEIINWMGVAGLHEQVRGEELELDAFARLSDCFPPVSP